MPLRVTDLYKVVCMDEEEYDLILQFQKEDEKEDDAERVKRLATASKYRVKRRATSTDEDDEDVDYMPRTRDRLPLSQRNDYTEALEDLEDFEESIQARYAARSRKKMYDEETTDSEDDEENTDFEQQALSPTELLNFEKLGVNKWDNKKEWHPDSWGTITQYVPGNSSTTYEAPTQGAGWANTPSGDRIEAGTPWDSSPAYANVASPYLPSTPGGQSAVDN